MSEPTLEFIAAQVGRLLEELRGMRDELTVLTSIVLRLDSGMTALLTENRATHAQAARLAERLRKLETTAEEGG